MISFIIAAFILIVIPGPDQALITRYAIAGGRRAGLMTMAGGALGVSIHATAAALGISALLLASATAFTVLKVAGAIYLVWMGIQTLLSARQTLRKGDQGADDESSTGFSGLKCLRQGFLSNSLNPKVALFFVTFLPQFIPSGADVLPRALLLSGVFALIYLAWFSLYVVIVDRIGNVFRRPQVRARIEQVTGLLLVGFGIRLALQQQ